MQVLSLGMSRTGTASMQAALSILGYETYHGFRAFADIRDYELWNPAYETKFLGRPSTACSKVNKEFLDKLLGHMNAVTDMPAVSFSEELITAYPEAKVVLVQRDVEAWYRSFERVFIGSYDSWLWSFIAWLDPNKVGHMNNFLRNSVARCQFHANSSKEFRSNAREVYQEHYADIRRLLAQRGESQTRLLEFDLKTGWEPLCKFLEKDVPKDKPFPRANEDEMIQEKIMVMLINAVRKRTRSAIIVLGPIIVAALAIWMFFSLTR